MAKQVDFGAFVVDGLNVTPLNRGPLDRLTFAAKDIFAVKGHTNSAGNPTWEKTHEAASQHAPAIHRLLENGARLRGMTVTDELMYSIKGDNIHYPPTINPRNPDTFSGGSSSGSAVAVASEAVDFALGTDTGGSVRIPSSYCGLYGIRPSHGLISLEGVIPLAPSFDTVGWMARDPEILAAVGDCLLPEQTLESYTSIYLLSEAWDLIQSPSVKETLLHYIDLLFPGKKLETCHLPETVTLDRLAETFRILQGWEAWQSHGSWIKENHPVFGRDIAGRFEAASKMKQDDAYRQAAQLKTLHSKYMRQLLGQSSLLIIPTTYGPAPSRNATFEEGEKVRAQTMKLTCIAGVSGLPQVTIPLMDDGRPVGLSFVSGYGTDRQLLEFVRKTAVR
ncbi:amidase [Sporolactobacillus sp. THM7-7]|nr:amidase [Sporolactobacillus sp. THM7-7]